MYKAPLALVMTLVALCGLPWTLVGAQQRTAPSRVVQMNWLTSTAHTQFKKPLRELVRDSATFRGLWRQMTTSDSMPRIDFRRTTVIVIAVGPQSSAGYEVHVRALRATGHELHVFFDVVEPGDECPVGAEVASPATVVEALMRVPASSPPKVVFHERKLVLKCSND